MVGYYVLFRVNYLLLKGVPHRGILTSHPSNRFDMTIVVTVKGSTDGNDMIVNLDSMTQGYQAFAFLARGNDGLCKRSHNDKLFRG
jgi:hypothetical protein